MLSAEEQDARGRTGGGLLSYLDREEARAMSLPRSVAYLKWEISGKR